VRLVGRYPAPVEVVDTPPPEISLDAPDPSEAVFPRIGTLRHLRLRSGGRSGPGSLLIALMMVPAAVALVATSLLLYVLVVDKNPELFASQEPEAAQPLDTTAGLEEPASEPIVEEQAETREPSRFQLVPRYGLAPSKAPRPDQAPRDTRPELQPQLTFDAQNVRQSQPTREAPKLQPAPETEVIDVSSQTTPVTIPPMVAQPPVAQQPPASAAQAAQESQPAREAPKPQPALETQAIDITFQTTPVTIAPIIAPPASAVDNESTALSAPQSVAQWDPGRQPVQTGPLMVPSDEVLLLLIRSSLFALHRSNITGDYNFLRNISSIQFHTANPAPKLFHSFANLRARGIDLSPVMVVQPKLLAKPQINQRGILRVSGFFPTEPQRIYFDLMFLRGPQGRWRLFGISADAAAPKQGASVSGDAQSADAQSGVAEPVPSQSAPAQAQAKPATVPETASPDGAPPLPERRPAAPERSSAGTPVEEDAEVGGATVQDVRDWGR
jgi:hypothetical protein